MAQSTCAAHIDFLLDGYKTTDRTPPNFTFEGLSFNTTATMFKDAHNYKIGPDTDNQTGIEQLNTNAKAATRVETLFYKDQLCTMGIYHNENDLSRIGGINNLHARLVQKYGAPSNGNIYSGSCAWLLGNTVIELRDTNCNGYATLLIVNRIKYNEARQAQKTGSNTGF